MISATYAIHPRRVRRDVDRFQHHQFSGNRDLVLRAFIVKAAAPVSRLRLPTWITLLEAELRFLDQEAKPVPTSDGCQLVGTARLFHPSILRVEVKNCH